jgi:hypothetical protein
LSTVEQVSSFTQLAATYPLKRRSTAELGRFASRARLVLNVFLVPNKLGYGGLASLFEARGDVGPPI